jgi:predicted ATPase
VLLRRWRDVSGFLFLVAYLRADRHICRYGVGGSFVFPTHRIRRLMLERLRIQNFKSWQDTGDIAFGGLTGFFGTNSSGKSSILQFLLMLKQTVESSDRSRVLHLGDDKSYVDLGTMYDILHNHVEPSRLNFKLNWLSENGLYDIQPGVFVEEKWSRFQFDAEVAWTYNKVQLTGFEYRKNNDLFGVRYSSVSQKSGVVYEAYSKINSHRHKDEFIETPSKFYIIPHEIPYQMVPAGAQYWAYELENLFNNCYYLGPLREYPSRLYVWAGEQTQSVGNRGERAVAALLSSRNQGPTIDMGSNQPKRTVEEHVAHWLKELGLIYSFKVQPIAPNRKEYEVRIQRTAESASVFLTDVGFGVSQILPVLVLLFYVPEGSTVILEQPEIHLHPAVQAGLADVFIDAIQRRKLQIVLESHSEHLLQRLQRRIAEEVINETDIKLYFTSIEQGQSKLTPLALDEYGNISNWPAGFFGNAFEEAAAKMKAEMKRKMQKS